MPVYVMKSTEVARSCSDSDVLVAEVLGPLEALDLALDERPVRLGLRHHLGALLPVLLDAEVGPVEEHRVPALLQAEADDLALRAMVEVERHRHVQVGGHRRPHGVEDVGSDRLHGLHRGLHDHRRPELFGGGEHRLHRQVVDDVDRRHAVPLLERPLHDVLGWHHRHSSTSCHGQVEHPAARWPRPRSTHRRSRRAGHRGSPEASPRRSPPPPRCRRRAGRRWRARSAGCCAGRRCARPSMST